MEKQLADKALQEYYDEVGLMFRSKGWQFLLEDLDELEKPLADIMKVTSEADLRYKQGQIDIINWLRNKRAATDLAYEGLLEQESD
jgi:hypothetical protein